MLVSEMVPGADSGAVVVVGGNASPTGIPAAGVQ